ncbi:hypothetical protein DBIPINDM_008008 (plasmid) [Mesorhizobium sp. AR02]|nr:hypothetical protein DBIPINDM_008008 [Mesorhizobium sp. AR02]
MCSEVAELGGETPLTLAQTETGDRGLVPYRPIWALLVVVSAPILQLFEPLWPDSRKIPNMMPSQRAGDGSIVCTLGSCRLCLLKEVAIRLLPVVVAFILDCDFP